MVCEPFTQWVLEDRFSLGRPAFEDVGVQVVADVEPYELMKLRLLNASHQALCYFGYLAGYRLVHEVAQDPLFADFLLDYMDREATPTLAPVPGIDLTAYKRQLIERFSNSAVRDTVARLCAESSDRIPKWLLPVIRENLAAGRDVTLSAAVVASWARYAEGVDEQGEPITVVDRLSDTLTAIAKTAARGSAGLRRQPGAVRRPRGRARLHRALPGRAGLPAPRRRPGHPGGPGEPHHAGLATRPEVGGMALVAGIDSSTQSCKIVVCEADSGRVVRTTRATHPAGTEVSAQAWLTAFREAASQSGVLDGVEAMAVGGQQHGMVTLDEQGELVRDALLWNDNRSALGRCRPDQRAGRPRRLGGRGRHGAGRLDDGVEDPLAGSLRTGQRRPHPDGRAAARLVDLADRRPILRSGDRPRRRLGNLLLRCDRRTNTGET